MPITPPLSAIERIIASVRLRGCSQSARALEWLAITGAVEVSMMSNVERSEACETSTTIPSRFISRTAARPSRDNPPRVSFSQVPSANAVRPHPCERQHSQPQPMEQAQAGEVLTERLRTLEGEHDREPAGGVDRVYIADRRRERDLGFVVGDLLVERIDHLERVAQFRRGGGHRR